MVPPPINVARKLMNETKDWGSCVECVRKNTGIIDIDKSKIKRLKMLNFITV